MVSIGKENNYKMKKKLLLTLVVLLGMTSAMAADKISRSNFGINLGETKTFGINLFNECTNYVGFQMDLTLPDGLTVNKSGCSLTSRIIDENQELTIGKQGDNTYRLTSTSFSLTPIDGTSGDLINVSITASDTYQGGNATISNIQFATSNSERVTMNDVAFAVNYGTITFADEQVKALCVANWDTNGDGELDMSEAASVTDLGQVFNGKTDITSFDELQYFTGLTNIGGYAFKGCTNLTSIEFPNSITSILAYAFQDCTALTSVYIGNSVTNIGERAFQDCSSLTSVVVNISSPLVIPASTFNTQDNATLFVPKDSRWSYASADYWKDFKTIKEFPDPDVNQDGYVDVVDVVDIARFVVGTPSDSFAEFLADLNGSGDVNVADAVVLVNEIAGDVNWSRPLGAAAVNDDILTLTRNVDQSLSFSLEGNSAYTAFQFDLMIPEGMDVTQMTLNSQRKQNHMLMYNKIGEGHYRVVVLSTSNQSFNETVGELLCIGFDNYPADGIIIDDIHFVTPQGNDLLFSAIGISGDTPTSISSVRGNNCEGKIYNLNGQSMTKTQKGLYIINGKKVVVK